MTNAQQGNLIQNGSFESFSDSNLFGFCNISNCLNWFSPNLATTDYYNEICPCTICSTPFNRFGHQVPKTGTGYTGIATWNNSSNSGYSEYKEYLSSKLSSNLKFGRLYSFKCWINLADTFTISCNNFGVYFSTDSIVGIPPENLNVQPQISNNLLNTQLANKNEWINIKGCFNSFGHEQYITLGNFIPSELSDTNNILGGNINNGSYYFIDDVSLYEVRGLYNIEDTAICSNAAFSKTLKVDTAYHNVLWNTGDTAHEIIVTTAGKYWVTSMSPCCGTVTDTITIHLRNPNAYKFNLGNDVLYCNSINKQLSIINPNLHNIVWSTGDTIPSITLSLPPGGAGGGFTYWATAQSECGIQTDTIIITKATIPNNIILKTDTTIYLGDTITITAIDGLEQYEWSTTSGVVSNTLLRSTSYTNVIAANAAISISAYTTQGCIANDSINIKTIAKPVVELPVIIPNPQIIGKGGTFNILNLPPNSSVILHDAMGQIVFEQNNYTNNFNLDFIAEGIYFYEINIPNKNTMKGKILLLKK